MVSEVIPWKPLIRMLPATFTLPLIGAPVPAVHVSPPQIRHLPGVSFASARSWMVRVDEYPAGPLSVPVARTKIRSSQIFPPDTEVSVGMLPSVLHGMERVWAVTCMNSMAYEPVSKFGLLMKPDATG